MSPRSQWSHRPQETVPSAGPPTPGTLPPQPQRWGMPPRRRSPRGLCHQKPLRGRTMRLARRPGTAMVTRRGPHTLSHRRLPPRSRSTRPTWMDGWMDHRLSHHSHGQRPCQYRADAFASFGGPLTANISVRARRVETPAGDGTPLLEADPVKTGLPPFRS